MMNMQMKEPALGGGFSGANVLNVNIKYTEESDKSQDVTVNPAYTASQKKHLAMDAQAMVEWVREGQSRGWSGRYLKQHVWAAFWHICERPEVHALLGRVDAAVAEVFPDEGELNFDDRQAYWAKQGHPHPELAAAGEVNGNKLAADLHKEAAEARGEIQAKPDIVKVVSRCPQLLAQAEARGATASYGTWRAVLSICKFCEAGEDVVAELTDGHSDYDYKIAVDKMQDISAPFRCSTFREAGDGALCQSCRFQGAINSPIGLGFEHEPKAGKGWK